VVGPTLLFSVDVTGISDVTAIHIHGPAAVGVGGSVIQSLCGNTADDAPACKTGAAFTGVVAAGAATRPRISLDSLVVLMGNGNSYVNIHTAGFGGGEIRGQVSLMP
jgi:hypothetical protein